MRRALCSAVLALGAAVAGALPALASPSAGADEARVFEQAVEAYRVEDWTTARTLWLGLLEDEGASVDRASVLYDLGNVAWREGRPIEAAAWYTACIREEPRHADAWANLEFVRSEAGLEPADRGDLSSTVRRLLTALTPAEAGWLAVGLTSLLFAVLALEAVYGGALLRRTSVGALVLLLLGIAPWLYQLRGGAEHPVFVVAPDGAALRSQPAQGGTVIGRLPPGAEADRVDGLPEWVRLVGPGGEGGWVERTDVVPIAHPYR